MYNALKTEIRILGQSSKVSVVPKSYIALVGDSYAQGQGDWLKKTIKNNRYKGSNPDYHSGHVIYRKTGIDVITYGLGGAGSVKGLVTGPIIPHLYINSLWAYNLDQPKHILVYFYEGNDFTDNSQYYTNRFLFKGYDENYYFKGYDAGLFYNTQYFDQYLKKEALDRYPSYKDNSLLRHMIFSGLLRVGWVNLKKEINRGTKNFKRWYMPQANKSETVFLPKTLSIVRVSSNIATKLSSSPKNVAIIGKKKITLPAYLQGPPVTLNAEQMKRSVYIFERSLIFMARFFSNSKISIIYIPGPASTYSMAGPNISFEAGEGQIREKVIILKASQKGCEIIHEVAVRNGLRFLDTRPYLRKLAKTKVLHGPEDYEHLNRSGQTLLADIIIKNILIDPPKENSKACEEQL